MEIFFFTSVCAPIMQDQSIHKNELFFSILSRKWGLNLETNFRTLKKIMKKDKSQF